MTPMLRELHEARKERLQRMKAWHNGNVVSISRIRAAVIRPSAQPEPAEKPKPEPKQKSLTPINEIPSPERDDGAEITLRQVKQVVAKRYNIAIEAMKSEARNQFVTFPRHIGYTLARRLTNKSLPAIGMAFGRRDHTTVLHGVRKIEERASKDPMFADELSQLEDVIRGKTSLACPCCGSISEEEET